MSRPEGARAVALARRRRSVALAATVIAGCGSLDPLATQGVDAGTGEGCPPACNDPAGDGSEDDFVCGERALDLSPKITPVMLVLDFSGSMTMDWDHDLDPDTPDTSRWYALHGVVERILDDYAEAIAFGLVLFPTLGGECEVAETPAAAPELSNGAAILDAMPDADAPYLAGGTPVASALDVAIAASIAEAEAEEAAEGGAVVLVSDGLPSCGETAAELVAIAAHGYTDEGVRSFVIGVGVEPGVDEVLDEVAAAGGTGGAYNTLDEDELDAIAEAVVGDAVSCIVSLDPVPLVPEGLRIFFGEQELPQLDDCELDGAGWVYLDPTYERIRLCGGACSALDPEIASLTADYACPPIPPA